MGLLEFSKLPVNTLVGADWKTFKENDAWSGNSSGQAYQVLSDEKRMQAVEFVGTYPRPQV